MLEAGPLTTSLRPPGSRRKFCTSSSQCRGRQVLQLRCRLFLLCRLFLTIDMNAQGHTSAVARAPEKGAKEKGRGASQPHLPVVARTPTMTSNERCKAVLILQTPESREVKGFVCNTLPFGATASVMHFNRVSLLLQRILWEVAVAATCYYDDFPSMSPSFLVAGADKVVPRNSSSCQLPRERGSATLLALGTLWNQLKHGLASSAFSKRSRSSLHDGSCEQPLMQALGTPEWSTKYRQRALPKCCSTWPMMCFLPSDHLETSPAGTWHPNTRLCPVEGTMRTPPTVATKPSCDGSQTPSVKTSAGVEAGVASRSCGAPLNSLCLRTSKAWTW